MSEKFWKSKMGAKLSSTIFKMTQNDKIRLDYQNDRTIENCQKWPKVVLNGQKS